MCMVQFGGRLFDYFFSAEEYGGCQGSNCFSGSKRKNVGPSFPRLAKSLFLNLIAYIKALDLVVRIYICTKILIQPPQLIK